MWCGRGTLEDTELINGLVFNQKTAGAGGPKRVEKAKIGLIQFCISPPKTDVSVLCQSSQCCQRLLSHRRMVGALCNDSVFLLFVCLLSETCTYRALAFFVNVDKMLKKSERCNMSSYIVIHSQIKLGKYQYKCSGVTHIILKLINHWLVSKKSWREYCMRCMYYALYQGKLGPVGCLQLLAILEISWNLTAAGNFCVQWWSMVL